MKLITTYIFLLIQVMVTTMVFSQNDTTYYNYNDTCINTSLNHYDKLLKHIIPDKKEINQLYKIDLFQLAWKRPNFSFEHKIKENISQEYEALIQVVPRHSNDFIIDIPIPSANSLNYLILSADRKYFHNLNSRASKGKNINGFSGNYFSTGLTVKLAFYDTDKWHINSGGYLTPYQYDDNAKRKLMLSFWKTYNSQSMGYLNCGYGIQRRIGNGLYWAAEAKIGVGSNKYFNTLYLTSEVNIKAGFAISSLKRNK